MTKLLAFLRAFFTSAPPYIVTAVAVLTYAADEIAKVWPGATGEAVVAVIVEIAGILTGALALMYRLTPVLKSERGFLPKSAVPAQRDVGAIDALSAVVIVFIIIVSLILVRAYLL